MNLGSLFTEDSAMVKDAIILPTRIYLQGLEDSLVGKESLLWRQEKLSSSPQHTCKSWAWLCVPLTSVLGTEAGGLQKLTGWKPASFRFSKSTRGRLLMFFSSGFSICINTTPNTCDALPHKRIYLQLHTLPPCRSPPKMFYSKANSLQLHTCLGSIWSL